MTRGSSRPAESPVASVQEMPSVLQETEVRTCEDRLCRLESFLFLGPCLLDRRVLRDQEVAGLVEIVDFVLQNFELALLCALRLFELLELRRLLRLLALLGDHEL